VYQGREVVKFIIHEITADAFARSTDMNRDALFREENRYKFLPVVAA